MGRLAQCVSSLLLRRAAHRAIGAEDTTVSLFGMQFSPTVGAGIANLAPIGWHRLRALMATLRAVDNRDQFDSHLLVYLPASHETLHGYIISLMTISLAAINPPPINSPPISANRPGAFTMTYND